MWMLVLLFRDGWGRIKGLHISTKAFRMSFFLGGFVVALPLPLM